MVAKSTVVPQQPSRKDINGDDDDDGDDDDSVHRIKHTGHYKVSGVFIMDFEPSSLS